MDPWPDVVGRDETVLACPLCFRRTRWALNTQRFVCPVHGPVITGDHLWRAILRPLCERGN